MAETQRQLDERSAPSGRPSTEDAFLLARSEHVDVLVDATGSVEFGAHVALEAFKHGKDVVLMNAEIDATIGPILQVYARKHGVILSACEGDEPGVQMNLYRWVKGLGLIPRVIGNVKGLQDPYRNPTTQKGFAESWGQNPAMVTSFADGSKISFEQAIVANATGFKVQSRGMSRGLEYRGDVMKIGKLYDIDEVRELGGIIDYVVGHAADQGLRASPSTPIPSSALSQPLQDGRRAAVLVLHALSPGPLRGAERHRSRGPCSGTRSRRRSAGPVVEVCAVAKRDLKAGEMLDDYGHVHDLWRGR